MKGFKVYTVYMDDGHDCYKLTVPAENKKQVENYVAGNGEIIKIVEADQQGVYVSCLDDTLRKSGWGQFEIDVITRALRFMNLDCEGK